MEPEAIVLDEPTAGLDPRGRDELFELLKKLNDTGMTVVIVSHSMEDVAKIAKRIIVIDDGKIALDGDVDYVFSKGGYLKSIGLDIPFITEVMLKLSENGAGVRKNIYTVEEAYKNIVGLIKRKSV